MAGTALTPVALALGVLEATGSAAELGIVLAAYTFPQVAFLVAGGVWADRLPRQRVMITADLVRAVTQGGMAALLLAGHPPLSAMVALQFATGAASAFFMPASVGLVADTAPAGQRQEANALLSLTRNVTGVLGPIVAASFVIYTGAGWALVVDSVSYVGSAVFLGRLTLQARLPAEDHAGFLSELKLGWREATKRSWVWTTIVYCMVFNTAFAAFQVVGPASLVHGGTSGDFAWGLVVSGLGAGQLSGSAMALSWRPERPLFVGRFIMLLGAPPLILLALGAPVPALVLGAILCGVGISFPDTLWDTALQEHVEPAALARVSSFDFFGSFLLRPVGLGIAAALAGAWGTTPVLVSGGVVMVVATVVSLADPGVRHLTRQPAPAPPVT